MADDSTSDTAVAIGNRKRRENRDDSETRRLRRRGFQNDSDQLFPPEERVAQRLSLRHDAHDAEHAILFEGEEGISDEEGDNYCADDLFDMLPDDVLGKVLFSGYVDTIRLINTLTCVSRRTLKVAKETVKMIDLRNCKHLTVTNLGNITSRFGNLSVSRCKL